MRDSIAEKRFVCVSDDPLQPAANHRGFQVGDWLFATKKAAEEHICSILDKHTHWQRLIYDEYRFVRALLELHPRSIEIIGCGIQDLRVEDRDGGRGFTLIRTDGEKYDWSWRDCLYPPKAFARISGICRKLVEDQKRQFRDEHFRGVCEVLEEKIGLSECHVDHIPPDTFEALLTRWLQTVGRQASDIEIISSTEYGVRSHFADTTLAQSWAAYHAAHAHLRCVCKHCNLSVVPRTSPRKLVHRGTQTTTAS